MTKKLMTKILSALSALFLLCVLTVAVARADDAKPADDDGYQKVDGNMLQQGETIPANRLVAGAYGFIFAAVAVWVATVASRSKRVEEEMEELKRKLAAKGK
jgi:hypothetical protein